MWVLTGWAGASRVGGTAARMIDLQTTSVHYFQRPDADYMRVDSNATSLSGWAGRVTLNKQKGDWMLNAAGDRPGLRGERPRLPDPGHQLNAHVMVGRR